MISLIRGQAQPVVAVLSVGMGRGLGETGLATAHTWVVIAADLCSVATTFPNGRTIRWREVVKWEEPSLHIRMEVEKAYLFVHEQKGISLAPQNMVMVLDSHLPFTC